MSDDGSGRQANGTHRPARGRARRRFPGPQRVPAALPGAATPGPARTRDPHRAPDGAGPDRRHHRPADPGRPRRPPAAGSPPGDRPGRTSAAPCCSATRPNCSPASPPTSYTARLAPVVLAGDHPGASPPKAPGGDAALADAWISRVRWLPATLARLPEPVAHRGRIPALPAGYLAGTAGHAGRVRGRERPPQLPPPGSPTSVAAAGNRPIHLAAVASGHHPTAARRGSPGRGAVPPPRPGPGATARLRRAPGCLVGVGPEATWQDGPRRERARARRHPRGGLRPGRPASRESAPRRHIRSSPTTGTRKYGAARSNPAHEFPPDPY